MNVQRTRSMLSSVLKRGKGAGELEPFFVASFERWKECWITVTYWAFESSPENRVHPPLLEYRGLPLHVIEIWEFTYLSQWYPALGR
jgi:hypothetical protein